MFDSNFFKTPEIKYIVIEFKNKQTSRSFLTITILGNKKQHSCQIAEKQPLDIENSSILDYLDWRMFLVYKIFGSIERQLAAISGKQ